MNTNTKFPTRNLLRRRREDVHLRKVYKIKTKTKKTKTKKILKKMKTKTKKIYKRNPEGDLVK